MTRKNRWFAVAAMIASLLGSAPLQAQEMMFGTDADADYAKLIWSVMVEQNLAGPDAVHTALGEGTEPHGLYEVFYSSATVNGNTGDLLVKRNYGTELSKEKVVADYDGLIRAVTVMFRREAGYDDDNKDWFWILFTPDGEVRKNEMGLPMAGRIAKGMDVGCIACHSLAEGDDFVYTAYSAK